MTRLLVLTLLALSGSSALAAEAADCTWTVSGTVRVDHTLPLLDALLGDISLLEGITIKVSSKERTARVWAPYWSKWDEVRTNSRGEFTVRKDTRCNGTRRFKIEAKFENDDLQIRHSSIANQAKWYTLLEHDDEEYTDHTLDIERTFGPNRVQDLDDFDARAHADMWVVYSLLLDELASYGPGHAFTDRLEVKYPSNTIFGDGNEASYANPVTNVAYIFRSNECPDNLLIPTWPEECEDHFSVPTLLHEAMHVWAYQHSTGEDALAVNLLLTGSTHCFAPTQIAFHEGFAEFAAERLGYILFGMRIPQPVTRDALRNGFRCEGSHNTLATQSSIESHDYGWITALRTVVKKDLHKFSFAGTAVSDTFNAMGWMAGTVNEIERHGEVTRGCESPSVDLKHVLTTFLPSPIHGYDNPLRVADMNLDDFLDRMADVNGLGTPTRDAFLTLTDPAATEEPQDLFCDAADGPRMPVDESPIVREPRRTRRNWRMPPGWCRVSPPRSRHRPPRRRPDWELNCAP